MIPSLVTRLISLVLGTLYPAYASYKAVRTKDVKEYVKWMMYWIVFALFTTAETLTDVFLAFWFPFYYELKVLVLVWLLSPVTSGSSLLYRKCVHPWLLRREQRIDEVVAAAHEQGYNTLLQIGQKGATYISGLVLESAIRAPVLMAQLVGGQGGEVQGARPLTWGHQGPTITQLDTVSDDEMDTGIKASTPIPRVELMEESPEESDGDLSEAESEERVGAARGGRRARRQGKKEDLDLSSGGDEDPDFEVPTTKRGNKNGAASKRAPAKRQTRKTKV